MGRFLRIPGCATSRKLSLASFFLLIGIRPLPGPLKTLLTYWYCNTITAYYNCLLFTSSIKLMWDSRLLFNYQSLSSAPRRVPSIWNTLKPWNASGEKQRGTYRGRETGRQRWLLWWKWAMYWLREWNGTPKLATKVPQSRTTTRIWCLNSQYSQLEEKPTLETDSKDLGFTSDSTQQLPN